MQGLGIHLHVRVMAAGCIFASEPTASSPHRAGYLSGLQQLAVMGLGVITTDKRVADVYHHRCARVSGQAVLAFPEQHQLALRQLAEVSVAAVSGPDEGGEDIAPTDGFTRRLARLRSAAQRT